MKPAQVIVPCEDKDHAVFAYRFLRHRTRHRVRVIYAPRTPQDRVALVVPTRSVETWLRCLDGHTVNETDRYPRLERPGDCKGHVGVLVEMCRTGQLRDPAPRSLAVACDEYRRVLS